MQPCIRDEPFAGPFFSTVKRRLFTPWGRRRQPAGAKMTSRNGNRLGLTCTDSGTTANSLTELDRGPAVPEMLDQPRRYLLLSNVMWALHTGVLVSLLSSMMTRLR